MIRNPLDRMVRSPVESIVLNVGGWIATAVVFAVDLLAAAVGKSEASIDDTDTLDDGSYWS